MTDAQLRMVQGVLGLTSAQAAVVLSLHEAGGWASSEALAGVGSVHTSSCRPWAVQQGVDAIRLKTGQQSFILGHAEHGWTLGAPGVRRIRDILGAGDGGHDG